MSTKTEPVIADTAHWVTIERHYRGGIKEEVRVYFDTEWRGYPAHVAMDADRYTYGAHPLDGGGTLSDWRIYASKAQEGTHEARGNDLTDLARTRLGAALRPLVEAWLSSTAYTVSETTAYKYAVRNMVSDLRPYGDNPTQAMRVAMTTYNGKLTDADHDALQRIADAFDAFASAYNEGQP